jgi:hypothetical protein
LAKEKDFVLAPEIVVEVGRREGSGLRNVAHAGFRKSAYAELSACCSKDFKASRKVAAAQTAVTWISG